MSAPKRDGLLWAHRRAELLRFIEETGDGPLPHPEQVRVAREVRRRRVGVRMAIPKGKR